MKKSMKQYLAVIGVAVSSVFASQVVHAQKPYPTKPIEVVVPYTPGGVADTVTRLITTELAKKMDTAVIVINQPGANSMIGSAAVARSAPDGYKLLLVVAAHAINPSLYKDMTYSPLEDLRAVSHLGNFQLLMGSSAALPPTNLAEYVTWAKANPDKANFASSGLGSGSHLIGTIFGKEADIQLTHVPYRGIAPALPDLFSGNISFIIDTVQTLLPLVKDGKVRAIAMTSGERWPAAPDVPTMKEQGYPNMVADSWIGILAPSKTPDAIVNKVSDELDQILKMPHIQEQFMNFGIIPKGGSAASFDEFILTEYKRWGDLIQEQNITIEQ